VTHRTAAERAAPAQLYRRVCWSVLRVVVSIAVIVTVYYYLPLDRIATWAAITMLIAGLVLLIAMIAVQVWLIARHPFPGLRAVEALATTIPLFLVLFASTYFVMERLSAGSFGVPLSRTDALYFTVTVFSTVGFGDITAKTQAARLLVTGQMIADLVFLGVGIKLIVGAVGRGQQRRRES
jgi:hypothetical protein